MSGVIASYERLIGKEGITSIKDIEGKRVAYPPNSTAQYALEAAISVNKLDRSKITLLPLRPAEMVAAWAERGPKPGVLRIKPFGVRRAISFALNT